MSGPHTHTTNTLTAWLRVQQHNPRLHRISEFVSDFEACERRQASKVEQINNLREELVELTQTNHQILRDIEQGKNDVTEARLRGHAHIETWQTDVERERSKTRKFKMERRITHQHIKSITVPLKRLLPRVADFSPISGSLLEGKEITDNSIRAFMGFLEGAVDALLVVHATAKQKARQARRKSSGRVFSDKPLFHTGSHHHNHHHHHHHQNHEGHHPHAGHLHGHHHHRGHHHHHHGHYSTAADGSSVATSAPQSRVTKRTAEDFGILEQVPSMFTSPMAKQQEGVQHSVFFGGDFSMETIEVVRRERLAYIHSVYGTTDPKHLSRDGLSPEAHKAEQGKLMRDLHMLEVKLAEEIKEAARLKAEQEQEDLVLQGKTNDLHDGRGGLKYHKVMLDSTAPGASPQRATPNNDGGLESVVIEHAPVTGATASAETKAYISGWRNKHQLS